MFQPFTKARTILLVDRFQMELQTTYPTIKRRVRQVRHVRQVRQVRQATHARLVSHLLFTNSTKYVSAFYEPRNNSSYGWVLTTSPTIKRRDETSPKSWSIPTGTRSPSTMTLPSSSSIGRSPFHRP
jgi:hypothetical protein